MSSDYTPSSGRRSSRRGGRRSDRQRGGPRPNRQETAAPVPPKKKSLWQKIAAFFLGEKPATAPASRSNGYGSVTPSRSERPARSERGERTERADRSERSERSERPARTERPSGFRKPEIVEVNSPRLYVGNLSFDASESDLYELFNGVGLVQNVEVVANKHTQKSKGFAFVQMQTVDEAKRAVAELHDKEYMGRKLVVSGAKAVEEKRSERQRSEASQQPEGSQAEAAEEPQASEQPEVEQKPEQ